MFGRKKDYNKANKEAIKRQQEDAERFGNELVESYQKQMDVLVENFKKTVNESFAKELQRQKEAEAKGEQKASPDTASDKKHKKKDERDER